MRGGEIGHTPSTVLDACVTQRAKHALGWGWGAIRITGRDSDARIVAGRNLDAACILGRDADARTVIGRNLDAARIVGRDSDARRALSVHKSPEKRPQCPNLARERGLYPKALTQTRSQARAWQNIPVRAILFHSPYEAPRYVGARKAAIAHAVMRSDSAEGGPWRTTPYKKIACA